MSEATISGSSMLDRIQAIERQVKHVRTAIDATRRARRLMLLFVVLFLAAVGLLFYQLYRRVQSPEFQQELVAAGQQHLESNAAVYQAEVQRLVEHVTPVLTAAMRAQTDKDMPLYTRALNEQRDEFLQNLRPQLESLVTDRYATILVSYEDIVIAEFPDAARPDVRERIHANLRSGISRLVKRYYVESMDRTLQEMFTTWDAFPPSDLPGPGSPTLSQQLIGSLMEILTRQISHPPSQVGLL
jgi:hypothetical protein